MCQAVAYLLEEGQEKPVLQDVVSLVPGEGNVRIVNLFGEEKVVPGRIVQIDLLKHRVIIDPTPAL